MAFLASHLVQNILRELGQVELLHQFDATGGSAITFVNNNFNNFETPPDQDAFKNYLAIVVRDAGGASASPENKWAVCSAYDDSTWTGTIATVTDAIASGDTIMLAKQDKYPLPHILNAINQGLESLGDIPNNKNTSLTTVSSQLVYDIPVGVKRGLKRVEVEIDNDYWVEATDARVELSGTNTASKLYLPEYDSGLSIGLVYDGVHTKISAYNDVINEYVHPRVATCVSIIKLLEWFNRRDASQDPQSYDLWLEGQYREIHLPLALAQNPIQRAKKMPRFFSKTENPYPRLFSGSV